jgi:adenine-specific DNA-methyltransferase
VAKIDDLVARVQDDFLREQLASATAELRRNTRFGLVFEQHIPETTLLSAFPVRPGAIVYRRSDDAARHPFIVQSVSGKTATVVRAGPSKADADPPGTNGSAARIVQRPRIRTETIPLSDLLVLKRFGEPVFPTLKPLGGVRKADGRAPHAAIKGENFHALQLLLHLYEEQVDCIYVDPPYNTGARDWKYNNHYVDSKDRWRHSKWLSFMEKRLQLARRLLKQDGILIVTIDEHEVHHLGMLLEQVFPGYLRHMVTIVNNPKGTGKHNFARVDEYAIFCVPNLGRSLITGTPINPPNVVHQLDSPESLAPEHGEDLLATPAGHESLDDDRGEKADPTEAKSYPFPIEELPAWELRHARRRGGESSYRHQRPNQFYPIYIDEEKLLVQDVGEAPQSLRDGPDLSRRNGLRPIWPIDDEGNERCWRFIPSKMRKLIKEERVVLGRYNARRDTWTLNIWERRPPTKKLKTVWWETAHDAGTHGTTLLHKLLGRRDAFSFPKSVYAVRDCLAAVVRERPNALILDFFAGSGTTLHATCLLNSEDRGRRRCILVTNNEVPVKTERALHRAGHFQGDVEFERHGVFETATRPRAEAIITGRRAGTQQPLDGVHIGGRPFSNGFDESVEFYEIAYLDPDEIELGFKFRELWPLLHFAAGSPAPTKGVKEGDSFHMPPGERIAVLLKESRFRDFVGALSKRPDVTHVWLVTDNERAFAEMAEALPPGLVISRLYGEYIDFFRRNSG